MEQQQSASEPVCSNAPDDIALLAAIDGDDPGHVIEHLATCMVCQERAQALTGLESALRARLFRACCPSSTMLAAYVADRTTYTDRLALLGHIGACPHCARDVAVLRQIMAPARRTGPHPPDLPMQFIALHA